MEKLARLRAQIASLDELRDLIRAMRALAASHVQEAQDVLAGIRRYVTVIEDAIAEAAALAPADGFSFTVESGAGERWTMGESLTPHDDLRARSGGRGPRGSRGGRLPDGLLLPGVVGGLRVAVARAIVGEPALVLADEPTANLDSKTGNELIDTMHRLNQERGVTFVFATHDPKVMDHASRVVRLVDGRVDEDQRK